MEAPEPEAPRQVSEARGLQVLETPGPEARGPEARGLQVLEALGPEPKAELAAQVEELVPEELVARLLRKTGQWSLKTVCFVQRTRGPDKLCSSASTTIGRRVLAL